MSQQDYIVLSLDKQTINCRLFNIHPTTNSDYIGDYYRDLNWAMLTNAVEWAFDESYFLYTHPGVSRDSYDFNQFLDNLDETYHEFLMNREDIKVNHYSDNEITFDEFNRLIEGVMEIKEYLLSTVFYPGIYQDYRWRTSFYQWREGMSITPRYFYHEWFPDQGLMILVLDKQLGYSAT